MSCLRDLRIRTLSMEFFAENSPHLAHNHQMDNDLKRNSLLTPSPWSPTAEGHPYPPIYFFKTLQTNSAGGWSNNLFVLRDLAAANRRLSRWLAGSFSGLRANRRRTRHHRPIQRLRRAHCSSA